MKQDSLAQRVAEIEAEQKAIPKTDEDEDVNIPPRKFAIAIITVILALILVYIMANLILSSFE